MMKRQIEELKAGKNKEEQTEKKEQNKIVKTKTTGKDERRRDEVFPPSPATGPLGMVRRTAKVRGPAEDYEEDGDREIRLGRWDCVGGRELVRCREEEGRIVGEMEENRSTRQDPHIGKANRLRPGNIRTGQNKYVGHSNVDRETEWRREEVDKYPKRTKIEVIVIHKTEQAESYADILKKTKNSINIEELGIRETRIRRTATGNLLIQIAGEESKKQADALPAEMRKIVSKEAVVGKPCRKVEIRISGLDTADDVTEAIMRYGDCERGEIRVGSIRRNRQGEGDIWVRCPWSSANELCKMRIRIGWVGARIEIMEPSPLQCYRCWEYGHVKVQCKNKTNRAKNCYRCGHRAAQCGEMPQCALCKEKDVTYNHRMDSRDCQVKNIYRSGKR